MGEGVVGVLVEVLVQEGQHPVEGEPSMGHSQGDQDSPHQHPRDVGGPDQEVEVHDGQGDEGEAGSELQLPDSGVPTGHGMYGEDQDPVVQGLQHDGKLVSAGKDPVLLGLSVDGGVGEYFLLTSPVLVQNEGDEGPRGGPKGVEGDHQELLLRETGTEPIEELVEPGEGGIEQVLIQEVEDKV